MRPRAHFSIVPRKLAFVLAALALALQALVPAGFMLAKAPTSGGIEITLCTSSGTVTAFLNDKGQIVRDADDGAPSDHDNERSDPMCGFAAQGVAGLAHHEPIVVSEGFGLTPAQKLHEHDDLAPGRGLAAPPPPKTGPPLQA
jgi:hypothetical protein